MTRAVVLDEGPLSLVTNPRADRHSLACARWVMGLLEAGVPVLVPEIADYELRRELTRAGKTAGLARLDAFGGAEPGRYIAITTHAMRRAARLWAELRNAGLPTGPREALDADVILAGQVLELGLDDVVVATTNPGHLTRMLPAMRWDEITP